VAVERSARGTYLRVADALKARIDQGEWKAGEAIPPVGEIAAEYQVSVKTATRAVAVLDREGITAASQGRRREVVGDMTIAGNLAAHVTTLIRSRIAGGEWSETLPSEMALAEEFAVSRSTVQAALRQLEQTGEVVNRPGRPRTVPGATGTSYEKAAQLLRTAIQSGKYPEGSQLPTEAELAQQLGVGRDTLRQGLALLREEGLVCSVARVGSFVRTADRSLVESSDERGDRGD